ncbi:MAG: LAGLIDADG family homing endonuclease [bacterium]|nr:LAGLIDADG family homing endonuclease [bacterium]
MVKNNFSVIDLANRGGCFDLQFRKDTRHERTGSPTYYRWKIQFVITTPKEEMRLLEKAKKIIGCGKISQTPGQARFSVQDIDDISEMIVPYFTKNRLVENKKKDFDLWQRAVTIIYANKGITISKWKKSDLHSLIEIHKSMAKYKRKPKSGKWLQMAQTLART